MRQTLASVAVAAIVTLAGAYAAAQENEPPAEQYKFRFEFWKFAPKLDAQVQRGTPGAEGTVLDAKGDLGLADEKTSEFHGALQLATGHKLRASYMKLDYAGDLPAARTFTYAGSTYTRTSRVVSTLNARYYSADYQFDLLKRPSAVLGLLVGGKYMTGDSAISAPELGISEADTRSAIFPVVGAAGRLYLGHLSVGGEVSGMTLGHKGHVYDYVGSAQIHISDRLAVGGGYHRIRLHGNVAPDVLDVRLGGWRYGVELDL